MLWPDVDHRHECVVGKHLLGVHCIQESEGKENGLFSGRGEAERPGEERGKWRMDEESLVLAPSTLNSSINGFILLARPTAGKD